MALNNFTQIVTRVAKILSSIVTIRPNFEYGRQSTRLLLGTFGSGLKNITGFVLFYNHFDPSATAFGVLVLLGKCVVLPLILSNKASGIRLHGFGDVTETV